MPLSRNDSAVSRISAGEPSRDREATRVISLGSPDRLAQFRHLLDLLGREPAEVVPVVGEPRHERHRPLRPGPADPDRRVRLLDRDRRIRAADSETR